MKTELLPSHNAMIAKFAFSQGLYFAGDVRSADKNQFFKIWWPFHDLRIEAENPQLLEKFTISFNAHRQRMGALITAYEKGEAEFYKCWECLGWAIAWYFQSRITNK